MEKKLSKHFIKVMLVTLAVIVTVFVLIGLNKGIFHSKEAFAQFITEAGAFGPILFLITEIITVLVLILPCAIGYPVATLAYGPLWGFILNAIATIAGSLLIFLLVRRWGKPFVEANVSGKYVEKYLKKLENEKFWTKFFTIMLLIPFTPDNVLCYITGLSDMSFKKYAKIIFLAKPWKILLFTYGSSAILEWLMKIF